MEADCGEQRDWVGLYRRDYDLATPESMVHPAKASWDLAFRILEHLEELGLASPETSVILDPMAGTGRFLLAACAKGYKSVAVELEPRFMDMMRSYCCPGIPKGEHVTVETLNASEPAWVVKYKLGEETGWRGVVEEFPTQAKAEAFAREGTAKGAEVEKVYYRRALRERKHYKAVSHCRCGKSDWHGVHRVVGNKAYASKKLWRELDMTIIQGDARHLADLLQERGLVSVTSPPYSEQTAKGFTEEQIKRAEEKHKRSYTKKSWVSDIPYSNNAKNIGNLPDCPLKVITSPPYANRVDDYGLDKEGMKGYGYKKDSYGRSEGQIGIPVWDKGREETYLSAMAQVYAEIARVADVLVVVLKNPTRNGKLRRLDLDTISLLEQTGWTIKCVHHAILFEEQEQGHMFAGSQKRVKGRMSFFKRLQWQKGTSELADHEDVLFAIKRGATDGD